MQTYTTSIHRLRNLTTHRLHTEVSYIYTDLEAITGEPGIMTHMIPNIVEAIEPWLRAHDQLQDPCWWDGEYRPDIEDLAVELVLPAAEQRAEIFRRYAALPHPFAGKQVLAILTK